VPAVTSPRAPRLLTARRGLDRSEWATTATAFAISSACYLRWRHPYLARGVVGDLVGLTLLSAVAWTRRRLRHEALICLASIAVVVVIDPEWPLAIAGLAWWLAVVLAVAGYLAVRLRVGTGGHQPGRAGPPS
jgi:predicted anti-sigma-YlaC factor YlaD